MVEQLSLPMSTRFVSTLFDSIDVIKLPDTWFIKQLIESSTKLSAHLFLFFVMIQDWLLPYNIIRSLAELHKSPSMKFIESKGTIF